MIIILFRNCKCLLLTDNRSKSTSPRHRRSNSAELSLLLKDHNKMYNLQDSRRNPNLSHGSAHINNYTSGK